MNSFHYEYIHKYIEDIIHKYIYVYILHIDIIQVHYTEIL